MEKSRRKSRSKKPRARFCADCGVRVWEEVLPLEGVKTSLEDTCPACRTAFQSRIEQAKAGELPEVNELLTKGNHLQRTKHDWRRDGGFSRQRRRVDGEDDPGVHVYKISPLRRGS
jgi:hypothetical protein